MSENERKPKDKTCTECGFKGHPDQFQVGTKICTPCNRDRVRKSRAKANEALELDVDTLDFEQIDLSDAFDSRVGLSAMLKQQLQDSINRALKNIHYQQKRLESATAKGNAKLINDASKALHQAETRHDAILIKLMEKLQSLEDLRAQSEKAKPVAFFIIPEPNQPIINATHTIPESYYPEGDSK